MTKSEYRVLSAMKLLDNAAGYNEHCLHGLKSIISAVHIVSTGRKSSELQIVDALAKLAAAGKIKADPVTGMGGTMRLWILT